jgi:hypothetical protein
MSTRRMCWAWRDNAPPPDQCLRAFRLSHINARNAHHAQGTLNYAPGAIPRNSISFLRAMGFPT